MLFALTPQASATHFQHTASFGGFGPGDGKFKNPQYIAVNDTHIYVTDTGNGRVQIFTLDGTYVGQFGSKGTGNGQFSSPRGIAVNDTHIFVADVGNGRVQIFDIADNSYVSDFGNSGIVPVGIAVNDTNIFVLEIGLKSVQVYTLAGEYVRVFGNSGTSAGGKLRSPAAIAINDTNVFVSDGVKKTVEIFTLAGVYVDRIGTIGDAGSTAGKFSAPRGIVVNDTHIFVADGVNDKVQIFTLEGVYVDQFGSSGTGNGEFDTPVGIAANDTSIFTVEQNTHKVQIFTIPSNLDGCPSGQVFNDAGTCVADTERPVIKVAGVIGDRTLTVTEPNPYTELIGAVTDNDPFYTGSVSVITTPSAVVADRRGTYTVTYDAPADAAGNVPIPLVITVNIACRMGRVFNTEGMCVADTEKPVIKVDGIVGDRILTVTDPDTYTELIGAVTDNDPDYTGSVSVTTTPSAIVADRGGTYTVTYDAPADDAGNVPIPIEITVNIPCEVGEVFDTGGACVADTEKPVIKVAGIVGDRILTVTEPAPYTELIGAVTDNDPTYTGSVNVVTTPSAVVADRRGPYTVTYSAPADAAGNVPIPLVITVNIACRGSTVFNIEGRCVSFTPFTFPTPPENQMFQQSEIISLTLPRAVGITSPATRIYTATPLPAGLSFDSATRLLSGTAEEVGTTTVNYRVGDSSLGNADALTTTVTFDIVVGNNQNLASIDGQIFLLDQTVAINLPVASVGTPPYTYTLTGAGGAQLPAGLVWNEGVTPQTITGAPTTITPSRSYTYMVTDSGGFTNEVVFTIEIIDHTPTSQTITLSPTMVRESATPTQVTATVTLSGGTFPVERLFSLGSITGTAIANTDFTPIENVSVTIPKNTASGSTAFPFTALVDTVTEAGGETVNISSTLLAVGGVGRDTSVTGPSAILTIYDPALPPTFDATTPTEIDVVENQKAVGTVGAFSASSVDDTVTYRIGGADAALFEVDAMGTLKFKAPPNFEMPRGIPSTTSNTNDYIVSVIATSVAGGKSVESAEVTVSVTNANDPPEVLIAEGTPTTVTNPATFPTIRATVTDPDAGETFTYAWTAAASSGSGDVGTFTPQTSTTSADTVWTPPTVMGAATTIILTLTVTDNSGEIARDTHTVVVSEALPTSQTLTLSPTTVAESGTPTQVTATVTLVGGTFPVARTFQVTTQGGTATAGTDYTALSNTTLTVPAEMTSGSVNIPFAVTMDGLYEPIAETVIFNSTLLDISQNNPDNAIATASTPLTINDALPTSQTLTLSPTEVVESATPTQVTATVTLVGGTFPVERAFQLYSLGFQSVGFDIASEGTDYTPVSGINFTIPAFATSASKTIPFTAKVDTIDEPGGEVLGLYTSLLVVGSTNLFVSNSILRRGKARLLIKDYAPAVVNAGPDQSVTVGDTVTLAGTATASGPAVQVQTNWSLKGTSQTYVDAFVAAGATTEAATAEYNRLVAAISAIGSLSGSFATTAISLGLTSPVVLTILLQSFDGAVSAPERIFVEDEVVITVKPPPASGFNLAITTPSTSVVTEGGTRNITLTATTVPTGLIFDTATTIDVVAVGTTGATSSVDGTNADFTTIAPFTITIPANQTSITHTFALTQTSDTVSEGASIGLSPETITFTGTSSSFAAQTATLTITDDDARPTAVTLSLTPTSFREGARIKPSIVATVVGATTYPYDVLIGVTPTQSVQSGKVVATFTPIAADAIVILAGQSSSNIFSTQHGSVSADNIVTQAGSATYTATPSLRSAFNTAHPSYNFNLYKPTIAPVPVTLIDNDYTFSSTSTPSVVSGTTAVVTVAASPPPSVTTATTYTITGGANSSLFSINGSTGALVFDTAPIFSSAGSNSFEVIVTASTGDTSDLDTPPPSTSQTITTSVNNAGVGVTFAPTSVTVTEATGTTNANTYTVVLDSVPSATVSVQLASLDVEHCHC